MNAPRALADCHGVSLEGGSVLEKVAADTEQVYAPDRASNPGCRGREPPEETMGTVHAKVKNIYPPEAAFSEPL